MSLSSTMESIVAIPAEQASGLPAKVDECSPIFMQSRISGLQRVKPIGNPPAIPLARHIISGVVFQFCPAHIFPVLPNPVWISSKINTRLLRSQISLISCKIPSSGTMIPVSPCIGSTITVPILSSNISSITDGVWGGTNFTPSSKGWNDFLYFSLNVTDKAPKVFP